MSSSGYHTILLSPEVSLPSKYLKNSEPTSRGRINGTWVYVLQGGELEKTCKEYGNGNRRIHIENL